MKVLIEFKCDTSAFWWDEKLHRGEVERILQEAASKVFEQLDRPEASVCDAPEWADILMDMNGNTVGTIEVVREA